MNSSQLIDGATPHDAALTSPPRVNVLGVGISVLNLDSAIAHIVAGAKQPGHCGFVTVTGVHGVVESQRDPELQKIFNRSFLTTPDGVPMVWIGRWKGHRSMDRVYGPELMLEISQASVDGGEGHFYFGGREGVAEELKTSLEDKFEGLKVVGTRTPPFRPLNEEEDQQLFEELQRLRPHYLWVGISAPKQERFMHDFISRHPNLTEGWDHGLIMLGVGAAFDFHTGRVRQAPRFIQRSGFEWLFRLCMDPKRLWKRYAYCNSLFLSKIFPQLMGLRKYAMLK